jgi:ATP-dependent Clp protease ATP-binding subunit ClpC
MRPELLNRIDKTVVFHALNKKQARKILDLQIEDLAKRTRGIGLGIVVSSAAKKWIVERGYDAKNGVRPLRRVIQDTIENELADGLLDEGYSKGDVVEVTVKKGELAYESISE